MAIPAIIAGAAKGAKVVGKGLKGSKKIKKAVRIAKTAKDISSSDISSEDKRSILTSPEGVAMMSIGIILDLLCIICVILIIFFGIGLLLAKIVYIAGLIIIGSWAFFRSGSLPIEGKGKKKIAKGLIGFLKRQWPKLAGKAIPAVGDALPLWTWTVYSELTNQ